MSEVNQLMEVAQMTLDGVKRVDRRVDIIEQEVKTVKTDLSDYKEYQKQNEYISPANCQELNEAVKKRCYEVLKYILADESIDIDERNRTFKKYYSMFLRKCWNDAKAHANVIGKSGVYTKAMHFADAKEYIGQWTPHAYGVQGYIEHLNNL